MSRTICDVTLYDLMAEDFSVWVSKNKQFGFDLQIEGDDAELAIEEKGIHPFAMESFADLCRRFLYFYDKVKAKEESELDALMNKAQIDANLSKLTLFPVAV